MPDAARRQYVVAALPADDPRAFTLRGGAKKLWLCKDREVMLSGPSETGKTVGALFKLHMLLLHFPGARATILRKTLTSLYRTAFVTYQNVVTRGLSDPKQSPVTFYGGEKPEWGDYFNGSRVYFAGMDDPGKVLSSEWSFLYINQAEEFALSEWEILTTRCTGRDGKTPYTQMIGDCNPDAPSHWILHRPNLRFFESRHEDNPRLYTEAGEITEAGKVTMSVLDALTGVRYQRLRLGKWVQAEGAIYDGWMPSVHVKDREQLVEMGYFAA